MANPFRTHRGGAHRPSRKPKIAGQDISLVRALDKATGKHLVTPETMGDPLQAGAKFRELADIEETHESHGAIIRESASVKNLLRVYPIYGASVTRTHKQIIKKTVNVRKINPLTDNFHYVSEQVIDWDATGDCTIMVDGKPAPAVTITNHHTIGRPTFPLLIPGSPFPVIGENTTQGNRFQFDKPDAMGNRRVKSQYETMPIFETENDGTEVDHYPAKPTPDYDPTPKKTPDMGKDPLRIVITDTRLADKPTTDRLTPLAKCLHGYGRYQTAHDGIISLCSLCKVR